MVGRTMRAMAITAVATLLASGCVHIELLTADNTGAQPPDLSIAAALSDDAEYAVIESTHPLVPGPTPGVRNVYRRHVPSGAIELVSATSAGDAGNGTSDGSDISRDGRWVVFRSAASDLVDDDTNGKIDVFVRDMDLGETTRLSVTTGGVESTEHAYDAAISGNGQFVAWTTGAPLVLADSNGFFDVYRHAIATGVTELVSTRPPGVVADGGSARPSLDFTGNTVVFESNATNLVTNDTNGASDIFVRFMNTTILGRVSTTAAGGQINGDSIDADISGNGLAVVFESEATDLVPGDTNGVADVFVKTIAGSVFLASVADDGVTQGSQRSIDASINANGTVVTFRSRSPEFGPGTGLRGFVRDGAIGRTALVSRTPIGDPVAVVNGPVLSPDGNFVSIRVSNADVIGPDLNGSSLDEYLVWWSDVTVDSMTPSVVPIGVVAPVTITGSGFRAGVLTEISTNPLLPGSDGIVFDNVTVVNDTTITAEVSVIGGVASSGPKTVFVQQNGDRGSVGSCGCLDVS